MACADSTIYAEHRRGDLCPRVIGSDWARNDGEEGGYGCNFCPTVDDKMNTDLTRTTACIELKRRYTSNRMETYIKTEQIVGQHRNNNRTGTKARLDRTGTCTECAEPEEKHGYAEPKYVSNRSGREHHTCTERKQNDYTGPKNALDCAEPKHRRKCTKPQHVLTRTEPQHAPNYAEAKHAPNCAEQERQHN